MKEATVRNVFVSLVLPDSKKKALIKKTIKELWSMQLKITPSSNCEEVRLVRVTDQGVITQDDPDFLALDAVAGSVVTGLKVSVNSKCIN